MKKIKMLSAAVALASVSSLASAAGDPPAAPMIYNDGPFSPAENVTNLSPQERQAFALLEGIMQAVEAKIHAVGCSVVQLPLKVYSDAITTANAAGDQVIDGTATLGNSLSPDKLVLNSMAVPEDGAAFRGEVIDVDQAKGAGYINGTLTTGYRGTMIFNSANNMMVGEMKNVSVMSINWEQNKYKGSVIKDFYLGIGTDGRPADGAKTVAEGDTHIVYDWGLQSLSKLGYPVEKYWQRSKTRRSDGGQGQTAFVKDRLVGVVPCRIAIALSGLNQVGVFQQSGSLSIQTVTPGTNGAGGTAPEEIEDINDI